MRSELFRISCRNCNNFSNELCTIIVGKGIPAYINRCASVANWMSKKGTQLKGFIDKLEIKSPALKSASTSEVGVCSDNSVKATPKWDLFERTSTMKVDCYKYLHNASSILPFIHFCSEKAPPFNSFYTGESIRQERQTFGNLPVSAWKSILPSSISVNLSNKTTEPKKVPGRTTFAFPPTPIDQTYSESPFSINTLTATHYHASGSDYPPDLAAFVAHESSWCIPLRRATVLSCLQLSILLLMHAFQE